jgi:DNA gyrase/topoisomerase IV subunit A
MQTISNKSGAASLAGKWRLANALEMTDEDLVADEECVVTVSHLGYVKRNPTERPGKSS